MFKEGVIFAAIVLVTLAAGEVLFATESHAFWGSGIQVAQPRDSARRSRQPQLGSDHGLNDSVDAVRNGRQENIERIVDGGIAGFDSFSAAAGMARKFLVALEDGRW